MREEKVLANAVVCFLVRIYNQSVLMAMKTDGIGKGCWNGYGGGIESGETLVKACIRELREESGIGTFERSLWKVGEVDCHNTKTDGETFVCKVHYFFCNFWMGTPESRPEEKMINPTWFNISDLPYSKMMPADSDFLPFIFEGRVIKAEIFLGPYQKKKIASTKIDFIESFSMGRLTRYS